MLVLELVPLLSVPEWRFYLAKLPWIVGLRSSRIGLILRIYVYLGFKESLAPF